MELGLIGLEKQIAGDKKHRAKRFSLRLTDAPWRAAIEFPRSVDSVVEESELPSLSGMVSLVEC